MPDFNYDAKAGLIARVGVPQASFDQLALAPALARIVAMLEVSAGFAKAGPEPVSDTTPERLAERMRAHRRKCEGVIQKVGIAAD